LVIGVGGNSGYIDESDPDILALRRQDGAFVAAFSALGATREGILEAAKEDYCQLLLRLRARQEQEQLSLDELPEHSAIVDSSGTIVGVNKAWKRFAKDNGADLSKVLERANYLDVCERATGQQSQYARSFGEGLRSVLSGREGRFGVALLLEEGGKLYMDPREPIPLEEVERMAGAAGAGEAAAGLTQPVPLEEVERRIEESQSRIEESSSEEQPSRKSRSSGKSGSTES
jgi:hypothetical protein